MSPSSPRCLTPLSRNCLRNGAACGYLGTSNSHPNSPSTNLTVDSMSLLPPVSSANTPTTSVFDVFLSQRFVEPFPVTTYPRTPSVSTSSNMPSPSFSTVLHATRADPFNTLPLQLSEEARMLLDHCEPETCHPFLLWTQVVAVAHFLLTIIPSNSRYQSYSAAKKRRY